MIENFLSFLSFSLFKQNKNINNIDSIDTLIREARAQTVFPLIYFALSNKNDLAEYQSEYFNIITQNVKITEEHKVLHRLLCENDIPYIFLKGCASAEYYPDPLLRTMGDVDFLVKERDIEKTTTLLLQNGYTTSDDFSGIHIAFENSTNHTIIELHRNINGIPQGEIGEKINALLADIFDNSVCKNNNYYLPSHFHHGLILLLHTASHITSEGIGLRHLCDWAVFVSHFTDKEFVNLFKNTLQDIGLWKFAQILTAFSVKYLGCPVKKWANDIKDDILQSILQDIINSGNFGKKDYSRYQQIKYISNRNNNTITNYSTFKQALINIHSKAYYEFEFTKKSPLLLPIGYVLVIFKYIFMVIKGKRKLDNSKLIKHASHRKALYTNFELFET